MSKRYPPEPKTPPRRRGLFRPPDELSSEEEDTLSRSFLGAEPTIEPPIETTSFSALDQEHLWRVATPQNEPVERPTPETTETRTSYDTAPELSEPVEHLFDALLRQDRPIERTETEISTVIPEREMATDASMGGPSVNPFAPITGEETTKVSEIKLNQPKPFTGKREDLKKFLQDTNLYLLVNSKVYDTDIKKIAFALSFMNEGDAASWKEQLLEDAMALPTFDLGTWAQFKRDLNEAFKPYDAPGDAREEMKSIRMGNNTIEEHIARFKMLVTTSDLDSSSPAVVDYFRDSLNIPLQRKILNLENPPKTLKEWYDWAQKIDNNFRRMQRILGRGGDKKPSTNGDKKKEDRPGRRWTFQRKDPNAMDIDAMTTEQKEEAMKKGLCFGCGERGHLSRDCPTRKKPTTSTKPPSYASTWTPAASGSQKKKMSGKELHAHIRTLTAEMDDEEKEKFYDEAEEKGF